ncbi:hypothetical protein LINGRAHAP2_LOCUS11934 [Linum grandiflorum]
MIFFISHVLLLLDSSLIEIEMCASRTFTVKATASRTPWPIMSTLFPTAVVLIFPCPR